MSAEHAPAGQFRLYRTAEGAVLWRLVAANNRVLATSAGTFGNLDDVALAVRLVRDQVLRAAVELVHDRDRDWVWRMAGEHGSPAAVSSRGYSRRIDCVRAIDRFRQAAPAAMVDAAVGRRGRFWVADR